MGGSPLATSNRLQDLSVVWPIGKVPALVDVPDDSIPIGQDQRRLPNSSLAVPQSERLDGHFSLRIAQQIKRKQELVDHGAVLFGRVDRDAVDTDTVPLKGRDLPGKPDQLPVAVRPPAPPADAHKNPPPNLGQ